MIQVSASALVALTLIVSSLMPARGTEVIGAAYVSAAADRGAIIWDMRSAQDYAKGHIPGAVNLGNAANVLRNPNTEDFLETEVVGRLLNQAGIDLSKEIITYANMGDWLPYWGQLVIRNFSGKPGKIFHGGMDEWRASGQAVSTEPTKLAPVRRQHKLDSSVQIRMPEVLKKLRNSNIQFVDTRTPAEYSGDDIRALRGGHIPGAINIPYQQNLVDPDADSKLAKGKVTARDGMALKTHTELKALYAKLDPNRETVVYCQSGARASMTAALLRNLGFRNVRVFDESWLGYGNNVSAPAESVQFLNINILNAKIKGLEAAVQRLTTEIDLLRASRP